MKKITLLLMTLCLTAITFAQIDAVGAVGNLAPTSEVTEKAWKFGGGGGLYGSQVQLVNWSAGGQSNISAKIMGDIFANYRKGKHSWENNFKGEWGMIKNEGSPLTKNIDMMELNSKYGYQLNKKGTVFIGGLLNFTSQFSPTLVEGSKTNYLTNFLAPGRLVAAVGLDWKPNEMFSLFFSPAAGRFIFVTDNGVDETAFGLDPGTKVRTEFGAYLKAEFKKEIVKNVQFRTALSLYLNYLDNSTDSEFDENGTYVKERSNRGNIDVDWTVGIDLIVNKWINVNIATQLLYDHNTLITRTDKDDNVRTGPVTQFSESLNVGFTYRFDPTQTKKAKAAAAAAASAAEM